MKYVYLPLIALIIASVSSAQKIAEDKTDDFEKIRKVKTTSEKLTKKGYFNTMVAGHAMEVDGVKDTSYTLYFFFRPTRVTSLLEGKSLVYLKYEDDSVDKLTYEGSYSVKSSGDFMGAYIDITEAVAENITKKKVLKIRIDTSNENIDIDVDEKMQTLIGSLYTMVRATLTSAPIKK